MTNTQPNPPRVAQALLRLLVRPSEFECIPGDLLEEYREAKRPSLGRLRADIWYVKHVLSVLVHLVWPCVFAIVALRLLTFPIPRGWNPSLVQAPGVSLLDALVFVWTGYYATQRTHRIATGVLAAGVTSVLGVLVFFVYAGITTPGLLLAPFEKPFIFVIVSVALAIALGFGIVFGSAGALAGRWMSPSGKRAGSLS